MASKARATRKPAASDSTLKKHASKKSSSDSLADDIQSQLKISNVKDEAKKTDSPPSKRELMNMLNSASAQLTSMVQQSTVPSTSHKNTRNLAESCIDSLKRLRILNGASWDVERAASGIVARLMALGDNINSITLLRDMRPSLMSLLGHNEATEISSIFEYCTLPLPVSFPMDELQTTIISSYLSSSLSLLPYNILSEAEKSQITKAHQNVDSWARQSIGDILRANTWCHWLPLLQSILPSKQLNSSIARLYSGLTKFFNTHRQDYPRTGFVLRQYGLLCILKITDDTVPLDTFWNHTLKHLRPGSALLEDAGDAKSILESFKAIYDVILSRPDRGVYEKSPSFMKFSTYWMECARKFGKADDLVAVSALLAAEIAAPLSPALVNVSTSQESNMQAYHVECLSVCALLTSAADKLEQAMARIQTDGSVPDLNDLKEALHRSRTLLVGPPGAIAGDVRGDAPRNIWKPLEALRRSSLKALDHRLTAKYAEDVLDGVVETLEFGVKENPSVEYFTPLLDSYFNQSRVTVDPHRPETATRSYQILSKALLLPGLRLYSFAEGTHSSLLSGETPSLDETTRATYVRSISASFRNTGVALLGAGKYAAAERFVRMGCILGASALESFYTLDSSSQASLEDKSQGAWKQLEKDMFNRWESLGACYGRTGKRQLALDAYLEAAKTPSIAQIAFDPDSISTLQDVFQATSLHRQLGRLIEKVTLLSVNDLLLPPEEVAISRKLIASGTWSTMDIKRRKPLMGLLLEKQVASLDSSMKKPRIQAVMLAIVEEALNMYSEDAAPLPRARVLIKKLELMYVMPAEQGSNIPGTVFAQLQELINAKSTALASTLQHQYPIYLSLGHLWMVLIQDQSHSHAVAIQHATDTCAILETTFCVPVVVPIPDAKKVRSTRGGPTKAKSSRQTPASKSTRGVKSQKTVPVTPTSKPSEPEASEKNEAVVPNSQKPDFSELFPLIIIAVNILAAAGATLIKIRLLHLIRALSTRDLKRYGEDHIRASCLLAQEYASWGKIRQALEYCDQAGETVQREHLSTNVHVANLLTHAEVVARAGDAQKSIDLYKAANALAQDIVVDEREMSTAAKIAVYVDNADRAASAARAYAVIQHHRDNPTADMQGLLRALSSWNRAARALVRLMPTPAKSAEIADDNPFAMDALKDTLPPTNEEKPKSTSEPSSSLFQNRSGLDGVEWRIAHATLDTLLGLVRACSFQGSPKEAEHFAARSQELAEAVAAPILIGRVLLRRVELQLSLGKHAEAEELLRKAESYLKSSLTVEVADASRLRGLLALAKGELELACEHLVDASSALGRLEASLATAEPPKAQSTKQTEPIVEEGMTPVVSAAILRRLAWIRREDVEEYEVLLDKLAGLPPSIDVQSELHSILAKLHLHEAFENCKSDMFLSSLAESTIVMPVGITSEKNNTLSQTTQDVISVLGDAQQIFLSDLLTLARRGSVSHVRENSVSLAIIAALRCSLRVQTPEGPLTVCKLLDISASVTASREMLECIQLKYPDDPPSDNMQWPSMTDNGTPQRPNKPKTQPKKSKIRQIRFDSDDETEENEGDILMKQYWASVRERYSRDLLDTERPLSKDVDQLPGDWVIVHMSITEDRNTLIVSRQQAGKEPLVFCLPLKDRREGEEDETLSFDDAIAELKDIVATSDASTRSASKVDNNDKNARAAWWDERATLDKRMKELLENIEFCWLGGFKAILSRPSASADTEIEELRTRFEGIFHRALQLRDKKLKASVRLEPSIVECFAMLSPKSRDEEIEDVAYFILDLYQSSPVPVVLSEVDVDQIVVELRMALEEHAAKMGQKHTKDDDDTHAFLVLDKNLQGIPWESIPILRGRSISRIPSLAFLLDRVDLCLLRQNLAAEDVVDRAVVDPRSAYYILNPSGDLKGTETRFKPWLKEMKSVGWSGIAGRVPSEQEFLNALRTKELVVYFGHGSGQQYVRGHKIRALPQCAATMLWGCSSGELKEMGEFDRVGIPYHYMLAGCPTLVANLWDVTDRDIDKLTQRVFDQLHLTPEGVSAWEKRAEKVSVVQAVAKARDVCKMKWLTGAAPVVYGIPFYL